MVTKRQVVKAFDYGTEKAYNFSVSYRFSREPKHMMAPPNFADETAFVESDYLKNAQVGEIVFIEWSQDRFYALDAETNQYIPGPTVWRKSKILAHADVPE